MGNNHSHCHDEDVEKLSVEEALERVRNISVNLESETFPVEESAGRILAEAVDVREDLPRFDQSAMDGYAVRSGDLRDASQENPITLPCEKETAAGQSDLPTLEPGEAARIFTGAPLPEGANAVVIQERVERDDNSVTFFEPTDEGANIRNRGEEVQAGSQLLEKGEYLNTGGVGLLLSQGYGQIETYRPPEVAIVATGDELIDPSRNPEPGQKRDTNSFLIKNVLSRYTERITIRRLADDRPSVKDGLGTLLDRVDVLFVSGGVSVGDRDYVRPVLGDLGVEEIFWKVNQKPGKPLYLGQTPDTTVMGLPGNPVSASVSLFVYGIPLIRKTMGYPTELLELSRGQTRLRSQRKNPKARTEFVRTKTMATDSGYRSKILEAQGSHMLSGLARANSLVVLPAELDEISTEQTIPFYALEDTPLSRELDRR